MKHFANFIIASFLFLLGTVVYAQSAPQKDYVPRDYSLVPPTPGVAQFIDFQQYQVDNFRGIPQISFPIYVIKSGALSVPITLSYHGGGIRTTQVCGNAGMGWTLSLGAEIGHTICGAPDYANHPSLGEDKIHGLFFLNRSEKNFRDSLINNVDVARDPNNPDNYPKWQGLDGKRYYYGLTDVANDTYNLYGLGLSAVFAYFEKEKIVTSSESPLIIKQCALKKSKGTCDEYGFEVYNQSGVKYSFQTQDLCRYDYSFGSPQLDQQKDSLYYASAWHLDEIADLNGNTITFHYHEGRRYTKDFGNTTYRYYLEDQPKKFNNSILHSVSSVVYKPQILDSICSDGVTVKINYEHESTTATSVPLINSISIIANGVVQREITFNYNSYAYHNSSYLNSVYDQGEKILGFEYFDPEYNGFYFYNVSQDFGGYNNGIENDNLVPSVSLDNSHFYVGGGANRSVDEEQAQKGILTKIEYPTGGSTQLEWESNEFNYVGPHSNPGLQIDTDKPVAKIETYTLRMCIDEAFRKLKLEDLYIGDLQEIAVDLSKYYNMNPANLYGSDYYHTHHFSEECPQYNNENYPIKNPPDFPHVRFTKVNKTNGNRTVEKVLFLDYETIEELNKKAPIILTTPQAMTEVTDQLHIGNRWMDHSGLNLYDNTARMHDPILMRYCSPDPLFAKYPGISPWSHCSANPANAVDPDGREITGEVSLIENYEKFLNNMNNAINKSAFDNFYKSQFSTFVSNQITQIKALKESKIKYEIVRTDDDFGYISAVPGSDNILVHIPNISGSNIKPFVGHELQHCYQYEKGLLSALPIGDTGTPLLYDLNDEIEAYSVSNIVHSGIFYFTIPNEINIDPYFDIKGNPLQLHYKWTEEDIIKLGGGYERIPKVNMSINGNNDPLFQRLILKGLNSRGESYNRFMY